MATIFTPGGSLAPGLYYIDRDDCIGDSLAWINANTNYLGYNVVQNTNSINSLQSQINDATKPGTILQQSISSQVMGLINADNNLAIPKDSGLGEVSIARSSPTSKIILELRGGHYRCATASSGFFSWFYVDEGTGFAIPGTGGGGTANNSVEYVFSPTIGIEGQHNAKLIYTPSPTLGAGTLIRARVYIARANTTTYVWNRNDGGATSLAVPFTFSITEIR